MLTYRTNVLLDKERQQLLSNIAKREKTSIGELIRRAIDRVYKNRESDVMEKRAVVVKKILEFQKKIKSTRGIDYRELVEYGRYR